LAKTLERRATPIKYCSGQAAKPLKRGRTMKKLFTLFALLAIIVTVGCSTDADIASHNLSKAADMFEINRRVVFYNGITDAYILSIEGRCSVEFYQNKFTVTVKTGPNEFKKHYLGRADNVFPFVEQLDSSPVDVYHYKVIFKPESVLPDIDIETSRN
jgi:hypothetical protein